MHAVSWWRAPPPPDPKSPQETDNEILDVKKEESFSHIPKNMDPLPIANWMNMVFFEDLFDPSLKFLANRKEHFNSIDSLGQYYLSLKPVGFYSNYTLNKKSFSLQTYGLSLNGGVTFSDTWTIGGRLAYSYSNLKYVAPWKDTTINSLYFGPSLTYLFEKAYIELMLLGVYNSYQAPEKGPSSGWDFDGQLASGVDFQANRFLGPHSFIQPNIRLNYLLVLEDRAKDSEVALCRKADFFRSCIATAFSKEFHQENKGIIIPNLSIGWALMLPMFQYASFDSTKQARYKSSNQAYVALGVTSIHKRGTLISLDLQSYIAKLYPAYSGNIKVEFDW